MSKNSLDRYALFYEKIEPQKSGNRVAQAKATPNYDKAPSLSEEQVKALSEDLRRPIQPQTRPHF
jgi:hypothetical protein